MPRSPGTSMMHTPPDSSGFIGVTSVMPSSERPSLSAVASSLTRASVAGPPIAPWKSAVVPTAARQASSRWPIDSNLRAPFTSGSASLPQPGATMLGQISGMRDSVT